MTLTWVDNSGPNKTSVTVVISPLLSLLFCYRNIALLEIRWCKANHIGRGREKQAVVKEISYLSKH